MTFEKNEACILTRGPRPEGACRGQTLYLTSCAKMMIVRRRTPPIDRGAAREPRDVDDRVGDPDQRKIGHEKRHVVRLPVATATSTSAANNTSLGC